MMFCTMFLGVLDIATRTLTFSNAGHNHPVVIAPDGVEFLKMKAGVPLGVMEGYPFVEETLALPEGARLLVYTDGVTEAKDEEGRLFGMDRLLDTLRAGRPVLEDLHAYVQKAPQSDDITILEITL